MLAVAEATSVRRTRLPTVFVAFGAEEPRGPTDDDHHYGSRHYVDRLGPRERAAVRGMVSLDRVGVGDRVPVGSADDTDPVQRALLAAARRAGAPPSPRPGSAAATTGRSSVPGCRARAWARRRTPATTRRATCRPSCLRRSSSGPGGSSPRGWLRAEARSPQSGAPAQRPAAVPGRRCRGSGVRCGEPVRADRRRPPAGRGDPRPPGRLPRRPDRQREDAGGAGGVPREVAQPVGDVARSEASVALQLVGVAAHDEVGAGSDQPAASERWSADGQRSPWTPQCR